jgi:hypothetical protein
VGAEYPVTLWDLGMFADQAEPVPPQRPDIRVHNGRTVTVGCAAIPARCTRRVPCSMKNSIHASVSPALDSVPFRRESYWIPCPENLGHLRCAGCGARLAHDNAGELCSSCLRRSVAEPPRVPRGFWDAGAMRDALASWHIGRVIRAFRTHPWHRAPITQETVGGWLGGLTQSQVSRIRERPARR